MTSQLDQIEQANRAFWSTAIQHNVLEYPDEAVIRFVAAGGRDFAINQRRKAIDIGCGSGRHSLLLARYGYQVTGLDLSEDVLQVARQSFEQSGLSANWLCTPYSKADLEPGSLDVVLGYGVLFLQSRSACLADLDRSFDLLKPGGRMLMSVRHPDSWFFAHAEPIGDDLCRIGEGGGSYASGLYSFHTTEQARELLALTRFVIEENERVEQVRKSQTERHVWETYWLRKPA